MEILEAVGKCGLFPQPMKQQGKSFPKLNSYIAAALLVAKLDPGTLHVVLDEILPTKQRFSLANVS